MFIEVYCRELVTKQLLHIFTIAHINVYTGDPFSMDFVSNGQGPVDRN